MLILYRFLNCSEYSRSSDSECVAASKVVGSHQTDEPLFDLFRRLDFVPNPNDHQKASAC